ncbi:MAG: NAD(P)H:quinone oxidoreductase [Pseudomonadota bacterium]
MPTNVLIPVYSMYGHTLTLAHAVAEGAAGVGDVEVRLRRIAEFAELRDQLADDAAYQKAQADLDQLGTAGLDDLRWADGMVWGSPTRYGNMTAQMKQLIDSTSSLWLDGALENKVVGMFTSTASIHGGQETTILTSLPCFIHLGMIVVGVRYGQNPQLLTTEGQGGSPYGASTVTGSDGSRQPSEPELATARSLGARVATIAARCKGLE